jgi:hypothetical protein
LTSIAPMFPEHLPGKRGAQGQDTARGSDVVVVRYPAVSAELVNRYIEYLSKDGNIQKRRKPAFAGTRP